MENQITIKKLNILDNNTAFLVDELQKQAYLVEAKLIDYYSIPPLKENIDDLKKSGEEFYGCMIEGKLAGIISFKKGLAVIDIHRLAVLPKFFHKGVGSSLLEYVLKNEGVGRKTIVQTAENNFPAIRLYSKFNFKLVSVKKTHDHLNLVYLERN